MVVGFVWELKDFDAGNNNGIAAITTIVIIITKLRPRFRLRPPHRRTVGPAQFTTTITTITTATVYAATVFLPEWLPWLCQFLTVCADYNPWVPGDFEFYWFMAMPRGLESGSDSKS